MMHGTMSLKFLDRFEPVLRLINFSPSLIHLWGNESHCQQEVCNFIYLKCKRRVPLSSTERGSLVTILKCMNATITYVSPLLMFPRSNMKAELLDSAPSDSIAACHKAGWIQEKCFTQRFKYFVRLMKLSRKDHVILTLGGHYSHSRNVEMIDCAQGNGMHIVCLLPRNTHKLQLLDFSCVQPLKTYYA